MTDARKSSNSIESRFDLAYNAAHALCLAALRRSGYRAENRYIVFQVLPDTLGLGPKSGAFLPSAIRSAIRESTRATSMSTSVS